MGTTVPANPSLELLGNYGCRLLAYVGRLNPLTGNDSEPRGRFQIFRHRYTPIVVYGWRMFRRTMESLQVWHNTSDRPLVNGLTVHSMVHTT
jgi:hypothetical protein